MLHIDTLLPLYPDDASRHLLLSQALAHTESDLTAIHHALVSDDRDAALQHVHKAKGTVSFLGGDNYALQQFDLLTRALRMAKNNHALMADAKIHLSFISVESILQELVISLRTLIHQLENKKCP